MIVSPMLRFPLRTFLPLLILSALIGASITYVYTGVEFGQQQHTYFVRYCTSFTELSVDQCQRLWGLAR